MKVDTKDSKGVPSYVSENNDPGEDEHHTPMINQSSYFSTPIKLAGSSS